MLDKWDSFYVIVGSAAGALIGLQFVVMTLVAERPPTDAVRAGAAFATPTIVHFSVVLGLSALVRVPWTAMTSVAVVCGLIGVCGIIYVLAVLRRMRVQDAYAPDLEDWLFHVALPIAAYAALAVSAWPTFLNMEFGPFGIGAAVLLLLFTGIHNAWDAVSYHVLNRPAPEPHITRDRGR